MKTVEQLELEGVPLLDGEGKSADVLLGVQRELTSELAAFIHGNGEVDYMDLHKLLDDIQPPASVARLAAEAAAAVLIGFERGYRMADGGR